MILQASKMGYDDLLEGIRAEGSLIIEWYTSSGLTRQHIIQWLLRELVKVTLTLAISDYWALRKKFYNDLEKDLPSTCKFMPFEGGGGSDTINRQTVTMIGSKYYPHLANSSRLGGGVELHFTCTQFQWFCMIELHFPQCLPFPQWHSIIMLYSYYSSWWEFAYRSKNQVHSCWP